MHTFLVKKGLKSIEQDEALRLMARGAVLVDVRLPEDYALQHCAGAVNVPLFRATAGDSGWDKAKRFIMASIVMKATGGWLPPPLVVAAGVPLLLCSAVLPLGALAARGGATRPRPECHPLPLLILLLARRAQPRLPGRL